MTLMLIKRYNEENRIKFSFRGEISRVVYEYLKVIKWIIFKEYAGSYYLEIINDDENILNTRLNILCIRMKQNNIVSYLFDYVQNKYQLYQLNYIDEETMFLEELDINKRNAQMEMVKHYIDSYNYKLLYRDESVLSNELKEIENKIKIYRRYLNNEKFNLEWDYYHLYELIRAFKNDM